MLLKCLFFYRVADDYEKHASFALEDPEKYLANALNAYLLVKKFTTDWKAVHSLLTHNTAEGTIYITISLQTSYSSHTNLFRARNSLFVKRKATDFSIS